LLVTFPDKRSFRMDLSTRAPCLLHKCRENDSMCVLKQQSYFCCGCCLVSMIL